MKCTIIAQFLVLAMAVSALPAAKSSPAQNEVALLFKRADQKAVSCGPDGDKKEWAVKDVQEAFNNLKTFGNKPTDERPRAGKRYFPRRYGNDQGTPSDPDVVDALNKIDGCHTGEKKTQFFEFPITDPPLSGRDNPKGSAGQDRVIAISAEPDGKDDRTFTYCMAITHRGGKGEGDGSYKPCENK